MLQRIDNNAVIRSVARGLNNDKAPETHPVDENFFLFLPGGSERFVFRFWRQREAIEGTDHMHVRIDRTFGHREGERSGIRVLLYVWFGTHGSLPQ